MISKSPNLDFSRPNLEHWHCSGNEDSDLIVNDRNIEYQLQAHSCLINSKSHYSIHRPCKLCGYNTGEDSIDIVTDVNEEIKETEAPFKQHEEDGIDNNLVDVG